MSAGFQRLLSSAVKVALLVGILVFFLGSGGGFVAALGEKFGQDWSFGGGDGLSSGGGRASGSGFYTGYGGYKGSRFDSGWKDALNDHDLLQEKIDSYNRKVQHQEFEKFRTWGPPSDECTSQKTWTQRCGYHR